MTAGTVNCEGALTVRAERAGSDTAMADIVRAVEAAQVPPLRRTSFLPGPHTREVCDAPVCVGAPVLYVGLLRQAHSGGILAAAAGCRQFSVIPG